MPKGFITPTNANREWRNPRIAVDNIGWYIRAKDDTLTIITLKTVDEDGSETLRVLETEAEIDALIEAAQPSEVPV
jgi:hypothetical protein